MGYEIKRGTTPTCEIDFNVDIKSSKVQVDICQHRRVVIRKRLDEIQIGDKSITFNLTQRETLKLKKGKAVIQVRYVLKDGTTDVADGIVINVADIVKDEVIRYEN